MRTGTIQTRQVRWRFIKVSFTQVISQTGTAYFSNFDIGEINTAKKIYSEVVSVSANADRTIRMSMMQKCASLSNGYKQIL